MTDVLLNQRAYQELKREIRELRSQLSNAKSLSRVGVRRHEAVWMPSAEARLRRFQLTEDLNTGASAAAVLREWDGTQYVDGDEITVWDWWSLPGGRGMWQGVAPMEGWAMKVENEESDYDIVWMEQGAYTLEFTLTSDFTAGVATATVTASWEQGVHPGDTITVHDDLGEFTDAITDCKGVAMRSEYADPTTPDTPYYKVIACQRVALTLQATLTANMCGDAPAVAAITAETQGPFCVSPGANRTLNNSYGHRGMSGDAIRLLRTFKTKAGGNWVYEVFDVTKHAVSMMTTWRVDGSNVKATTVTAAIEYCAAPAEAVLFALTSVTYVSDISQSSCDLTETRRTLLALGDAALDSNVVLNLEEKTFVTNVTADATGLDKVTFTAFVCSPSGNTTTEIAPIEECD